METANELWAGLVWFCSSPETNALATAFLCMTTFVFSWVGVTELVNDYWPLSAERRGMGLIRAVLNLSLIAGLTFASLIIMALIGADYGPPR